ncbi:MAG TPA: tRNA adenosine deaminase-associated protein [Mycobacteriales bacterium]|nr:tRNA adenosine deaminase-associated protein [Mycobacteriales bacterium]
MPYFAAVLARDASGWSGEEVDLKGVDDLDGLVEEMRGVHDDAQTLLLFVEEDDEWFAAVRVDGDSDPRVFLSDGRATATSELAALLAEAAEVAEPIDDDAEEPGAADEDEEEAVQPAGEPIGDADLLTDLGTPAARLLALCAEEGQLPADIVTALCERAGCGEALDALRIA